MHQSSAAIGPQLNATIGCQEIDSVSLALYSLSCLKTQNCVLISETVLTFQVIKERKHYVITAASWLIEYCHTGNFGFQY